MNTNTSILLHTHLCTHSHTHFTLRSLLHVPLESLKVIPWVFANNWRQNEAPPFQYVSSSVEGTHLRSSLYWFKSIWANLINTTVLVLQMSVSQKGLFVCDELQLLWEIHSFEVIGLMCSPEPWCVQPFISPHHLSAALIRCSLNGTRLASHKF